MKFHFGKPNTKQIITTSIVLSLLVATLSQCVRIDEKDIWDIIDEIQRTYFPNTIINPIIVQDPEKIDRRVKRDVRRAIENVLPEYDRIIREADRKYQPRYFERPIDSKLQTGESKLLGGEMRICAHWVPDCSDSGGLPTQDR